MKADFPALTDENYSDASPIETAIAILKIHGFRIEIASSAEPDGDAVAIYAEAGEWTHFAKYTNGVWSSKLGEGKDVQHAKPQDLEGPLYGQAV